MVKRFAKPQSIISHMYLWKGDNVLVHSPTCGFFTPHILRAVGDSGRLFVYDHSARNKLSRSAYQAHVDDGCQNIHMVDDSYDIPFESLDAVLIEGVSESDGGGLVLQNIIPYVRSGGKICIVDFMNSRVHEILSCVDGMCVATELPSIAIGDYHQGIMLRKQTSI